MKLILFFALLPTLVGASARLAGGTHHFCFSDDDGVKCWAGPFADEQEFKHEARDTSFEEGHPCRKWGNRKTDVCQERLNASAPALLPFQSVTQLWAAGETTCAIHEGQTSCWPKPSQLGPPITSYEGRPLATNGETVCIVRSDETVVCSRYVDNTPTPDKMTSPDHWGVEVTFRAPLKHIRQLVMTRDHVCAIDDSGVQCGILPSDWNWSRGRLDKWSLNEYLGRPEMLAANASTVCALTDFEVRCFNTQWGKPFTPPITLNIGKDFFEPETFGEGLRWMERHSYKSKSAVFRAALEIYGATNQRDGRLFLMNALRPFLDAIDSPFFKDQVLPRLQERLDALNKKGGIKALRDFPRHPNNQISALKLLSVALLSLKHEDATGISWFDEALAATGQALADANQLSLLQRLVAAHHADLALLSTRGGEGALMAALADYLAL